MTDTQKKALIRKHVKNMLKQSHDAMVKKIEKAMSCGALNISDYDPTYNSMILPKVIVTALLKDESTQYSGRGTSFEKSIKKEVKNLKYFL